MEEAITESAVSAAPRPSLGALIIGVFVSPARTMAALVENPSWLFPLLITAVLSGAAAGAMYKPIIVPMQMDKMAQKSAELTTEQLNKMEAQMTKPVVVAITAATWVIGAALMTLIAAAVLYFLGSMVLGGQSKFSIVFAVVAWAGLIGVLSLLIQTPIRLVRAPGVDPADLPSVMESLVGLGFLVPANSGSFGLGMVRGLLSSIELFWLWQCAVMAVGVSAAFKKPRAFGVICVSVVWVLAAVLAAVGGGMQANS